MATTAISELGDTRPDFSIFKVNLLARRLLTRLESLTKERKIKTLLEQEGRGRRRSTNEDSITERKNNEGQWSRKSRREKQSEK